MRYIFLLCLILGLLSGCESESEETLTTYLEIQPLDRQILRADFGPLYVGIQVNDGTIVTRNIDRRSDRSVDDIEVPVNQTNTITIYWLEDYTDPRDGETSLLYLAKQVQRIPAIDQLDNFTINAVHDDTGQIPPGEIGISTSGAFGRFVCDPSTISAFNTNLCSADADGDGVSNLKERQMGDNPLFNPNSIPVFCDPTILNSNCTINP